MKDFVYFIFDNVSKKYLSVFVNENHETFKRFLSSQLLSMLNDPKAINTLRIMNDCDVYYFEMTSGVFDQDELKLLFHIKDFINDLKSKNGVNLDKVDK